MEWTVVKRVFVGGGKNFVRGGAVSVATMLIMTVTLVIIGSLIFLSALLSFTLTSIKDKVDVTVYFVSSASEADILAVESQLEKLPQVSTVTYTSQADALTTFQARHAGDESILQGLDELGYNPLDASLEIQAKDPTEYEGIVDFLNTSPALSESGTSIIDRTNYAENKASIDRLTLAITATREVGIAIVILFAIASILITLATIRLAIYTAKDEIAVMRLVGATNAYIRGPFVVTGLITGLLAAVIALLLLIPAMLYVATFSSYLGGFNAASYYASHAPLIVGTLVGSGIVLGALASLLAVRRYLRV